MDRTGAGPCGSGGAHRGRDGHGIGSDPITLIASVLFLAGIVFGLGLLGAALWRSRVAPAWMGIALMIGGITHPALSGHVAQGIGLIVATAGFAGATLALLRLSNDDFDLHPAAPHGPIPAGS